MPKVSATDVMALRSCLAAASVTFRSPFPAASWAHCAVRARPCADQNRQSEQVRPPTEFTPDHEITFPPPCEQPQARARNRSTQLSGWRCIALTWAEAGPDCSQAVGEGCVEPENPCGSAVPCAHTTRVRSGCATRPACTTVASTRPCMAVSRWLSASFFAVAAARLTLLTFCCCTSVRTAVRLPECDRLNRTED